MKFIATDEAIAKANEYGLTEHEVIQEFNARVKLYSEDKLDDLVFDWKGKEIVVLPIGKKTAMMFVYGQELKGSYEDLPQYKFKKNMWVKSD